MFNHNVFKMPQLRLGVITKDWPRRQYFIRLQRPYYRASTKTKFLCTVFLKVHEFFSLKNLGSVLDISEPMNFVQPRKLTRCTADPPDLNLLASRALVRLIADF